MIGRAIDCLVAQAGTVNIVLIRFYRAT